MASLQDLYITDRNPSQEGEYQNLLRAAGIPFTVENGRASVAGAGIGGNGANRNAITGAISGINSQNQALNTAQQVRDFTIASNQPAIQQYEASKQPLQARYQALLDTVHGNQTTAENRQIQATNAGLAARGIANDSELAQKMLADSLNPITSGYNNEYAQLNAQQGIDLSGIDQAIAMLKAGNPSEAIQFGLGINNAAQNAAQFQQTFDANQQQQQAANELARLQLARGNNPNQYQVLSPGQTLYDLQKNQPLYVAQKLQSQLGGSDWSAG